MSTERLNIYFHGDNFTSTEKSKIKADLAYHMRSGPSDATLCCCIFKEEKGLACNIRVHSATGHIFIHRESHHLDRLLKYVYDSMEKSFSNWHQDQKHFSQSHPLTKSPCMTIDHQPIDCPLHNYAEAQ